MGAPAGFELLSEGSWNPGSVSGEWSPGGCGCDSGSCSCGGSCGCKGEGGGSCGGGKPSGEVPLLPDYDGEIWASSPTWHEAHTLDEIRAAVRKALERHLSEKEMGSSSFWSENPSRELTATHFGEQRSPWSEVDPLDLDRAVEDIAQAAWESTQGLMAPPEWCVIHCYLHYFIAGMFGTSNSVAISLAWEILEALPRVLPLSEHVIDLVVCDRFGDLLAANHLPPVLCNLLTGFPDRLPGW